MNRTARTTACLLALVVGLTAASSPAPSYGTASPAQQLFMMKEVKPDLARIGIIWDGRADDAVLQQALRAAQGYGVQVFRASVERNQDVGSAFRELHRTHRVQALWVITDTGLIAAEPTRSFLVREATRAGLPILAPSAGWVRDGAPLAVVAQGEGVRLVVNRTVAHALSLQVPAKYGSTTEFLATR